MVMKETAHKCQSPRWVDAEEYNSYRQTTCLAHRHHEY